MKSTLQEAGLHKPFGQRPAARPVWMQPISSYLFLLPATLVFMAFIAYPIAWVAVKSLFSGTSLQNTHYSGLDNYIEVITDPVFWTVMKNMFLWLRLPFRFRCLSAVSSPTLSSSTLTAGVRFFAPCTFCR